LRIDDSQPDQLELSIQMRQSADGAATWYSLRVSRSGQGALPWKKSVKTLCCDEHASAEDKLAELNWKRQLGGQRAEVSVAYFAKARDTASLSERSLFVEVAKRAADDCLVAAGANGGSVAP